MQGSGAKFPIAVASRVESLLQRSAEGDMAEAEPATERVGRGADLSTWFAGILMWAGSSSEGCQ
jgi:hypothetical protein